MQKNAPHFSTARLGTYLTLGVGAGVLGSPALNATIVFWDTIPVTTNPEERVYFQPTTGFIGKSDPGVFATLGLCFNATNYIYNIGGTFAYSGDSSSMNRFFGGDTIDGSSKFKGDFSYLDNRGWNTADSPWATGADGASGFIGIRFYNDQTEIDNYGWLAVTYNAASQNLVIGNFAYENSGAGIIAGAVPEPSSLALLALGATGLLARRRRTAA